MQERILDLARQGLDAMEISTTLTQEGHRSPRRNYVPIRTVQIVRQRHRVLKNGVETRARHISGWLTIDAMAQRLQISSSWIKRRIHSGAIEIQRDPKDNRYLFPDTEASIAALMELRAGTRDHLVIDPRANK